MVQYSKYLLAVKSTYTAGSSLPYKMLHLGLWVSSSSNKSI